MNTTQNHSPKQKDETVATCLVLFCSVQLVLEAIEELKDFPHVWDSAMKNQVSRLKPILERNIKQHYQRVQGKKEGAESAESGFLEATSIVENFLQTVQEVGMGGLDEFGQMLKSYRKGEVKAVEDKLFAEL